MYHILNCFQIKRKDIQNMKKYTVYEIEKLTDGKLSKYKLTRAIHSGDLKAESVANQKKGRGTPNFYVYEDDLKLFLEKIEQEKNKKIEIYDANESPKKGINDISNSIQNMMENNKLWTQNQGYKIDELLNRVHMLEKEQSQIIPLLQESKEIKTSEEKKSEKRKTLIIELSETNTLSDNRKKEILQSLTELA
jgi:hypothetical protein